MYLLSSTQLAQHSHFQRQTLGNHARLLQRGLLWVYAFSFASWNICLFRLGLRTSHCPNMVLGGNYNIG